MAVIPKKYNVDPKDAPFCKCGCGTKVMWNRRYKDWSKFIKGHGSRCGTMNKPGVSEKIRAANLRRWGTPESRYKSYVGAKGVSGCMIWKGPKDHSDGYGVMKWKGVGRRAHRIAYEMANGRIPDGMCICHTCDTRLCVNPDHLFLGTSQDNQIDKLRKGRGARGVMNPNAVLTEEKVRAILVLRKQGYGGSAIARMFGVSQGCISHVFAGRTWGYVKI